MRMSNKHKRQSDEKVMYVGDSRVRKGSGFITPRDYTEYPGKSEAFIPNFLLKEWMVAVVFTVGILVLTIAEPAPLGYPANPSASLIPMPDWYFLFLYQYLKYPYASGDYILLGVLGVNGVAFGSLLLVPFLDTSKERKFYRRPIASSLMLLSLASIVYLTNVAWTHYEDSMVAAGQKPEHIEREERARENKQRGLPTSNAVKMKSTALVGEDDPARETFQKAGCVSCHATDLKGASGPSLRGIGDKRNKEEIYKIIKEGYNSMPPQYNTAMASGVSNKQLDELAKWLGNQKTKQ